MGKLCTFDCSLLPCRSAGRRSRFSLGGSAYFGRASLKYFKVLVHVLKALFINDNINTLRTKSELFDKFRLHSHELCARVFLTLLAISNKLLNPKTINDL